MNKGRGGELAVAMPHYFFDTYDGETFISDEHGVVLAGGACIKPRP